jgi:hypothetical protein
MVPGTSRAAADRMLCVLARDGQSRRDIRIARLWSEVQTEAASPTRYVSPPGSLVLIGEPLHGNDRTEHLIIGDDKVDEPALGCDTGKNRSDAADGEQHARGCGLASPGTNGTSCDT